MNPLLPSCFDGPGQTYSAGDDDSDEESKEPISALPKHLKEVDLLVLEQLIQRVETLYVKLKSKHDPRFAEMFQVDEMVDQVQAELEQGGDSLSKFLKHSNQQAKIIVSLMS